MGSVNRPNLGICTSADDERARRKKQMRWGTKPRQASEAGDALEEGKPSSSFPLVVKLRCSIPQQEARLICEMGGGKDSSVSFDCIATAATPADRPKNCNYKRTGIGANRLIRSECGEGSRACKSRAGWRQERGERGEDEDAGFSLLIACLRM